MEIGRMGTGGSVGILVDTNILMYVYDKVDPFNRIIEYFEYKPIFYIHKLVLQELDILSRKYKNSTKMESRISLARQYLEVYRSWWKLVDIHSNLPTDEALIATARDLGLILFTNDEELRRKALEHNVEIIFMGRQGKIIKSFRTI
ncbi:MAG: PIN domain-containing protein [Metallosphaera sp.]|nr:MULTISPECIES: PIN domain-containing protein [Metallosphaera]MCP6728699.1 PIN domain-containing protein [Metallosphaera sedula]MCY0862630.1 PIN domain-containing protein [Metallosphaera prunae]QCO30266.1 PIN domain-containing protein [Metallosphaera prunae]WPX06196.1 PIN domain-containing protein [Metallosphaera sedula DSM 5348]BBL48437.1 ribonuclease VapC9 [Metallosphaera sedula]